MYISIYDIENNIRLEDSHKFVDNNFEKSPEFTYLSTSNSIVGTKKPWADFWKRKIAANNNLITSIKQGRLTDVRKLINKYHSAEDIADPQYIDSKGMGAIHYAVVH